MKPKILCGDCGVPIMWGDRCCGSCGKPVEWSDSTKSVSSFSSGTVRCKLCGAENDPANAECVSCGVALGSGKEATQQPQQPAQQRQQKKKAPDRPGAPSWKMVAGFALFLVVGVLSLDLLTAKKVENVPHTHDQESTAANMQALQQIEEMEKRLSASPNDSALLLQLANLLHDSRFTDKAIQRYTEYLQKNPKDVDARVDLGICYYETDRTSEAKQQMLKALEYNPKHLLGAFNLGIVHLRIAQAEMTAGNTEKAEKAVQEANEWFRKTAALDPSGSVGQRAQRLLTDHANQQNLPTN